MLPPKVIANITQQAAKEAPDAGLVADYIAALTEHTRGMPRDALKPIRRAALAAVAAIRTHEAIPKEVAAQAGRLMRVWAAVAGPRRFLRQVGPATLSIC